jgi:hypothetical protein
MESITGETENFELTGLSFCILLCRGGNRAGRVGLEFGRVESSKFEQKKFGSRVGFGSIQSGSG